MVSGTPLPMRLASHVMARGLSRTQPCETAVPSAPERLLVPWRAIWPGPPSNSCRTCDRALVARVIEQVNGTHQARKTGDLGVDGWSFMYGEPIQVKQSSRVGREVVDSFETAVERSGKEVGYIVAFSFTRGAHEEVARAKAAGKASVILITVADLLAATESITRPTMPPPERRPTPDLMRLLAARQASPEDQPLPFARPKAARPSVEELVESERAAVPA